MTQPPYQQPPGWQPPQQPITWGTTPPPPGPPRPPQQPQWSAPPPRPPKPRNKAGKVLGIIAACIVGFFIIALTIGAIVGEEEPAADKPAVKTPAYEVVDQDDSGHTRNVVVEVSTTKDLRAVFDAVTKDLTEEAGYFVSINCSKVGVDKSAARLANGKVAVGAMGAAATGLEDGQAEFAALDGRTCPAT